MYELLQICLLLLMLAFTLKGFIEAFNRAVPIYAKIITLVGVAVTDVCLAVLYVLVESLK